MRVVRKNAEIDRPGKGEIVEIPLIVKRSLLHEIKSVVIPWPHTVPGIKGKKATSKDFSAVQKEGK